MRALLPLLLLLPATARAAPEPRPVVAVFDFEAENVLLDARALAQLTDELVVQLTGAGFTCVPREVVRQRLLAEKTRGFRASVDEASQLELGRELAAQKTVVPQVAAVGDHCRVRAVLFDLTTSSSERAASLEAPCAPSALVALMPRLAAQLRGAPGAIAEAELGLAPAPLAARPEAPAARPENPTEAAPAAEVRAETSTARDIVACTRAYSGPSFLGWCSEGTFGGVVHLGAIGLASTERDVIGLAQVGVVTHVGGSFYGLAQVGAVSYVRSDFAGLVQGGAVNVVREDFAGLVQGGGVNWVGGRVLGTQVGGFNRAQRVRGAQIGVINWTEHLRGVQLGLLNFAGNGVLPVLPLLNVGF